MPILLCPQAHLEGHKNFVWAFFIHHLSITVGNNGFGIYVITFFYLIDHSGPNICIIINEHCENNGESMFVGTGNC